MTAGTLQREQEPTGTPPLRITRRRGLPRGRAVVGGFLVALAAVLVFAAHRRADALPSTSYVTVTRDVAPGDVLTDADLALVALELPEPQAAGVHAEATDVVGSVAIEALQADQLVARGDVRPATDHRAPSEVAFSLPRSTALAGTLSIGERVDVLATYGSGPDATTLHVVRDAIVLSHDAQDALGGSDVVTVRLGVLSSPEAAAVTHAAAVADVALARGAAGGAGAGPYRPFGPTSAITGAEADTDAPGTPDDVAEGTP